MPLRKSETINVSFFSWKFKPIQSPWKVDHVQKQFLNICFICNGLKTVSLFQNNLNPDWKDFLIYESELGTGTNDDIELVYSFAFLLSS